MPYLEKFGQDDDLTSKTETSKFGSRKSFSKLIAIWFFFFTAESAEIILVGLCPDDRRQ